MSAYRAVHWPATLGHLLSRDAPDNDVTERCQDDRQPDGSSVNNDAETCVQQEKVRRRQRVPVHRQPNAMHDFRP